MKRRHASTPAAAVRFRSTSERFHAKTVVDEATRCVIWTAYKDPNDGYGRFNVGGVSVLAHRWAFEHFKHEIGEGLVIDHLCRVRACVNPDHLRQCTPRENVLEPRSQAIALKNALTTHCPQGHAYDEVNTKIRRDGWRECRQCQRVRNQNRNKEQGVTS